MDRECFFLFEVGDKKYAVPADCVRQVIPMPPVWDIPGFPSRHVGITMFRGEILPVITIGDQARPRHADGNSCRAALLVGKDTPELLVVIDRPLGLSDPGDYCAGEGPQDDEMEGAARVLTIAGSVYAILTYEELLNRLAGDKDQESQQNLLSGTARQV